MPIKSTGSLSLKDDIAAEFGGALDWFLDHPQESEMMGRLGRAYVRREFNWPAVLDRFRAGLMVWLA